MPSVSDAHLNVEPEKVWSSNASLWTVHLGQIVRGRGRPERVKPLFQVVAEKLPFECIDDVRRAMRKHGLPATGVYMAHDSMGYARYIGRGDIFPRLKARKRAQSAELYYFSFYVVLDKKHEREIESLLIRAAGPQLHFNTRKRRQDIQPGDVLDFERGTIFFERRGRRA